MKKGFTLIELLVVVLIIGILSAIAIPQYQKAVRRSRAAEARLAIKRINDAMNEYYLANGAYPQMNFPFSIEIGEVHTQGGSTITGFTLNNWEVEWSNPPTSYKLTSQFSDAVIMVPIGTDFPYQCTGSDCNEIATKVSNNTGSSIETTYWF